jgi:hypothetical protein
MVAGVNNLCRYVISKQIWRLCAVNLNFNGLSNVTFVYLPWLKVRLCGNKRQLNLVMAMFTSCDICLYYVDVNEVLI